MCKDLLGAKTVIGTAGSESRQARHNRQNETESWSQVGRPVNAPAELMIGFVEGTGLLFLAGESRSIHFYAPPWGHRASGQSGGQQSLLRRP
jgi:hypothetical protein